MPDSLITIEAEAFSDNRLASVIIPSHVTSIGDWAFQYNNLTEVTIPSSVTSIGFRAFANNALERVTLFNKASVIGARAFDSSVTVSYSEQAVVVSPGSFVPDGAPFTDDAGFQTQVVDGMVSITGYTGVEKVLHIPEQINGLPVTSISVGAFAFNRLTELTIPGSVTSIGRNAFIDNRLSSLIIPEGVISIGAGAFAGNRLTSVSIPDSVTSIGAEAFANNRLVEVTVPSNVTYIGMDVFDSNVVITRSKSIVANVPKPPAPTLVESQSVQAEENSADFQIRVENRSITIIGYTGAAKDLHIPEKISGLPVAAIGAQVFAGKALTRVSIPDSVVAIGAGAFCDNALVEITLPSGVVSIGASAFANNRLTQVTIPNSVTDIGDWAFQHNRLSSVSLGSRLRTIGASAFAFNRLTSVTLPASVVTIGASAFYDNGLTSVTFSNGLTAIGERAFAYNALTSVALPNSVTFIGDWAFAYNRLTRVTIPNSAATIGEGAFSGNPVINVVAGNVLKRGVVSYKLFGEEYADEIDRVELQWSTEFENWLPEDHARYNEVQATVSDYHTLKMTIYQKDGGVGSFTFKGGVGTQGDTMRWVSYWSDSEPELSKPGYWKAEGNLFWYRNNGYLVVPDWIEINCTTDGSAGAGGRGSLDYSYSSTSYSGTSSLIFSTPQLWGFDGDRRLGDGYSFSQDGSEAIIIQLDDSFFPDPLIVGPVGPCETYNVTVINANADVPVDALISVGFTGYYASNGKKAGRYTYNGIKWSYEAP
jgi:hypothetical protein